MTFIPPRPHGTIPLNFPREGRPNRLFTAVSLGSSALCLRPVNGRRVPSGDIRVAPCVLEVAREVDNPSKLLSEFGVSALVEPVMELVNGGEQGSSPLASVSAVFGTDLGI